MAQYFRVHPTHPQPRLLRQAALVLADQGVIAYPTDSSYALGCRLGDFAAADRIRAIRGVDEHHYLTLVCKDLADAAHYVRLANWQFRLVRQGIPGAFTFLLPATREVPRRMLNPKRHVIGIRVPDHAVVRALLAEVNAPILSSTLIPAGDTAPLNDPGEIRDRLQNRLDAVIDAGPCPAVPTTVIDLTAEPPVIVRQGSGDLARLGLSGA
jgi:tRNA threonylcarbamoyl adenosine modification protein (Sua5/YciO/YrdC/YwlC family)